MKIGVIYPDKYAVEETFQLLKVPWEWYTPDNKYDVVITKKENLPSYSGNIIDLTRDDIFLKISDLLNRGEMHLHMPSCDIYINSLRNQLKQYGTLIEIPPIPWGHQYMVALTHDADVIDVRQSSIRSVGSAMVRCFTQGDISSSAKILLSKIGILKDQWVLFEKWMKIEREMDVRSTFFFIPSVDTIIPTHKYRDTKYDIKRGDMDLLVQCGWEVGVHGMNIWYDGGKSEQFFPRCGNRTHWLIHDASSWEKMDYTGFSYDSTFGYDDDIGFRAGTLQVYKPRETKTLLELPLHIQDTALLGKSCWSRLTNIQDWISIPCLNLSVYDAEMYSIKIFNWAKRFGGVVTILWHYEHITPPRDWSLLYKCIVDHAKRDGAWISTATNIVEWFRKRRSTQIESDINEKVLTIRVRNFSYDKYNVIRVHINPSAVDQVDTEFIKWGTYIDIKCDRPEITMRLI